MLSESYALMEGNNSMLAPLAIVLAIMLITCTLILLISWVCDHYGTEFEAGPSRAAVSEFPVHHLKKKFPPVSAPPLHLLGGGVKLVVYQRGAASSLSSKRNFRQIRRNGMLDSPRRFDMFEDEKGTD
jgi:hypothetical protein